jgi:hypothetical protein
VLGKLLSSAGESAERFAARESLLGAKKMNKNLIELDANLFRAAYVCVSTEETRYYLKGVFVEPHPVTGALLTATDGHRLIVIYDEKGICTKSTIVSLDSIGLRACAPHNKTLRRLLVRPDGIIEIPGAFLSSKSCIIDSTYPEYRRIIPDREWPNKPASFNVAYFKDFERIGGMLSAADGKKSDYKAIRVLTGDKDGDPALVLYPHFDAAFGILMPMRADIGGGLPAWMKPVMEKPKAAPAKATVKKTPKKAAKKR